MDKTIVISDMHCPHHDKKLFKKLIKYAHDLQPTGIVILGDFLDMLCFGSYSRGSLRTLKKNPYRVEIAAGKKVLDQLDAIPSVKKKHFIYGNHEDRIFRWLDSGDNDIVNGHIDLPEDALELEWRGWKVHSNWKEDFVQLGPLQIIHGMFCGIHTAKKHMEYYGDVMFGHTHRMQSYSDRGMTGYNIGFLGDLDSPAFKYISRGERVRWRNGFATVHHNKNTYYVDTHEVRKGKFLAAGKIY
jgi:predicted phosphodiesterase